MATFESQFTAVLKLKKPNYTEVQNSTRDLRLDLERRGLYQACTEYGLFPTINQPGHYTLLISRPSTHQT